MGEALIQNNSNDEKMYLVQKVLKEGKTKFQAARAVGYRGVDGLDKYAKGLGYTWNILTKSYELKEENAIVQNPPERIMKILSMIERGIELNDIAKYFKMKDSQELAEYMKNKGYEWDVEKNNYMKKCMILCSEDYNENSGNGFNYNCSSDNTDLDGSNVDILKLLESNKGRLIELLAYKSQSTVPRYLLNGMPVTKGFFISVEIDRLIKDFSREKNILQKDIIQTALIEFFQRYGYKKEVDAVLKN